MQFDSLALRYLFSSVSKQTNLSGKDFMGKCHLLSTLQYTTLPCLLNWGHVRLCQQVSCLVYWLSLPHLCCLFQITCGCNENNDLSNWWLLSFCSEPLGTRASNAIMSITIDIINNWILVACLILRLSCIYLWGKNYKICNNILKFLLSPKQMAKSWLDPFSPDVASMLGSTESDGQP